MSNSTNNTAIKAGDCQSLNGKTILSYELAVDDSAIIWLRLSDSTGNGFYSKEWILLDALLDTLAKAKTPFSSFALAPLFRGRSINTPAFLMAVLLQEGLVTVDGKSSRRFQACDPARYLADARKLAKETAAKKPTGKRQTTK